MFRQSPLLCIPRSLFLVQFAAASFVVVSFVPLVMVVILACGMMTPLSQPKIAIQVPDLNELVFALMVPFLQKQMQPFVILRFRREQEQMLPLPLELVGIEKLFSMW